MKKWGSISGNRKHLLFKRGKKRIENELDVMNMIKASAMINLISKTLLSNKQKLLLSF
jgi:hypothetical protein